MCSLVKEKKSDISEEENEGEILLKILLFFLKATVYVLL